MKVKATKPGYFGKLREMGDEFDVPEGATGSWFSPVDGEAKAKGKAKAKPDDPLAGGDVESPA